MKGKMAIVGGAARPSKCCPKTDKSLLSTKIITRVYFLQRRRWVTKKVSKNAILPLRSSRHYTRIKTWSKIWQITLFIIRYKRFTELILHISNLWSLQIHVVNMFLHEFASILILFGSKFFIPIYLKRLYVYFLSLYLWIITHFNLYCSYENYSNLLFVTLYGNDN